MERCVKYVPGEVIAAVTLGTVSKPIALINPPTAAGAVVFLSVTVRFTMLDEILVTLNVSVALRKLPPPK